MSTRLYRNGTTGSPAQRLARALHDPAAVADPAPAVTGGDAPVYDRMARAEQVLPARSGPLARTWRALGGRIG